MKISKELKAGLIAILAIISFVILFQFMKGKNLFSTDDYYFAKYENVEGLAVSNKVSINGLNVGQVAEIQPVTLPNGKIYFVVKIAIDDKFHFSKNSNLEIFEPGFMAGKQARINISYGGIQAKSGDTLAGKNQESLMNSLSSKVDPVKDQLSSVLMKVDSTLASTNKIVDEQNRREIKMLLGNLNQTVSSFKGTSDEANKLLTSNDSKIASVLNNADKTMLSATSTIDKYGKVADNLDVKQLNSAVEKLSQVSTKLDNVISGIQNGQGSLGKLTKDEELYNNLNKTSQSLNSLIIDLKENPKRYINISIFGKNNKN